MVDNHIKDINISGAGKKRILWADRDMPVLASIRKRFEKERPLKNVKVSACLHVTTETANLVRTLKAGGAEVVLCASNPLSTQDDVAASLVKDFDISVFAIRAEDNNTYYEHIKSAISHKPVVIMDDGADLVTTIIKNYPELCINMLGSTEETTTGVVRLKAMQHSGNLKFPVIAVNDAKTKYLFDNRYGTGQSTMDGIIRATNRLIAGRVMIIAGYGWCGKGLALRANGAGAKVVITEVDPVKALEAAMDGFSVMPMSEAIKMADIIVTVTGDIDVLTDEHFSKIKDGCIICNSGHFNVEINIESLSKYAVKINKGIRDLVDEYILPDERRIYLIADGRLVNLAAAEGHPASVMDMSFATQAMAVEYLCENKGKLESKVLKVPENIENIIATQKLKSMNITIDVLTDRQKKYLESWEFGT
jgi:adenosylhomocysteinase